MGLEVILIVLVTGEGVGVGVKLGDAVGVGITVGEGVTVGVAVGSGVTVGVGLGVGVGVGVGVGPATLNKCRTASEVAPAFIWVGGVNVWLPETLKLSIYVPFSGSYQ